MKNLVSVFISMCVVFLSQSGQAQTWQNYYDQFLFLGTCPKPVETTMFETLASNQSPAILITKIGEILVPSLEVQLFADGTFYVEYGEHFSMFGKSSSSSASQDGKLKGIFKKISGSWRVQGFQIILDGIGTGEPGRDTFNNPAIYLVFNSDVGTSGLIGKQMKLVKAKSNRGPRDACN